MPTRADIRESEEKLKDALTPEQLAARETRRALRAQVRAKAKELNDMRPQPPGQLIEQVLEGLRQGQTVELTWPPA